MSISLKDKTTKEILAFSLLPFGMSTIYGIMATALNLYFTDVLGLSLAMTSIVLSATKIWDAINDPLMGMIVDKTHTKMGKLKAFREEKESREIEELNKLAEQESING